MGIPLKPNYKGRPSKPASGEELAKLSNVIIPSVQSTSGLASASLPGSSITTLSFYHGSNSAAQFLVPGTGSAISISIPFRGSVVGMSFNASTACSGTYTVHIGGAASGAVITASASTAESKGIATNEVGFSEGARLDVRATNVSTAAVVIINVYLLITTSSTV